MLTFVFKHHSNAKTTQPEHKSRHFNPCWSCQKNSRCPIKLQHGSQMQVLGHTFAVLAENGEALLWAVVFLNSPIDGGVDIVRVVCLLVYTPGSSEGHDDEKLEERQLKHIGALPKEVLRLQASTPSFTVNPSTRRGPQSLLYLIAQQISYIIRLWGLQSRHRVTTSKLFKACSSNERILGKCS